MRRKCPIAPSPIPQGQMLIYCTARRTLHEKIDARGRGAHSQVAELFQLHVHHCDDGMEKSEEHCMLIGQEADIYYLL